MRQWGNENESADNTNSSLVFVYRYFHSIGEETMMNNQIVMPQCLLCSYYCKNGTCSVWGTIPEGFRNDECQCEEFEPIDVEREG